MKIKINSLPRPKALQLQWHITEKCNWCCKHCYRDEMFIREEMNLSELLNVLDQYTTMAEIMRVKKKRIAIGGGEPFLRKRELFEILSILKEKNIPALIMTNGSLITRQIAKKLKELRVAGVQVSMEGRKKVNDEIRGVGAYSKIIRAIKLLAQESIPVSVSFTSHKKNFKEFFKLIEVVEKAGASVLWTDRLVPIGMGSQLKEFLLTPSELREYYFNIVKEYEKRNKNNKKMLIGVHRTLFFLIFEENPSIEKKDPLPWETCPAGSNLLVVMPNGDVYPCRRLPIKVGNVREEHLLEIWYKSNILWKLRDVNELPDQCKKCKYLTKCYGGARCVAYGYFGDYLAPDPQCWVLFKNLPEQKKPICHSHCAQNSQFVPKPHINLGSENGSSPNTFPENMVVRGV